MLLALNQYFINGVNRRLLLLLENRTYRILAGMACQLPGTLFPV